MPSQTQVQQTILSAQYKLAKYQQSNLALVNAGSLPKKVCTIDYLNLNTLGLTYRANIGDYTSSLSETLYDRLLGLIGIDTTANVLDPNYQNPTSPIIVPGQSAFGFVKSGNIVFTNQISITLSNWQTIYAPYYGQSPEILLFTTQGGIDQQDTQTQIIPTYSSGPTSLLESITWTYPIATTGYYTISGQIPTTGGGSVIGATTYFYIFAGDPNISYDGSDNFVYTFSQLVGKSGYYIYISQNNQNLIDGIGIQSNPSLGSFTILNNPGFVLQYGFPIIVNVR